MRFSISILAVQLLHLNALFLVAWLLGVRILLVDSKDATRCAQREFLYFNLLILHR